jgi:hypothetical protein
MPPPVHDCEDDNFPRQNTKVDGVRESAQAGPTDLAMNSLERFWIFV